MPGMAVFGTPSPPDYWASGDIVRIVDPLGTAAGWVVPALAGACVGFSTRQSTEEPWRQIVIGDPPDRRDLDDVCGFAPILRPNPDRPSVGPPTGWAMHERDPISVTVGMLDNRRDERVIVQCDERAVVMTLFGTGFGGFRLTVAVPEGSGWPRWHYDGPGRLVIGPAHQPIMIEHSLELTTTVVPGRTIDLRTLSVQLDLAGRLLADQLLFARLSEEALQT